LFIRGGRGNVAKSAGVAATERDVEGPLRQALVFEIVHRDYRSGFPKIERLWFGLGHAIPIMRIPGSVVK
jgi:hypothetical protein